MLEISAVIINFLFQSKVRSQDCSKLILSTIGSVESSNLAWEFYCKNIDEIRRRYGTHQASADLIEVDFLFILGLFCLSTCILFLFRVSFAALHPRIRGQKSSASSLQTPFPVLRATFFEV